MRHVAIAAAVLAAGCSSGGGSGDNAEPPRVLDGKVTLRIVNTKSVPVTSVVYRSGDFSCDDPRPECEWVELLTEPIPPGESVLISDFPEGRWSVLTTTHLGSCQNGMSFLEEFETDETDEFVFEVC